MLYADRVQETTISTGTNPFTLLGAVAGFRTYAAAFSNGDSVAYFAVAGAEWEMGVGTYSAGVITRDGRVFSSSNSGALVSFSAGTKAVFCTIPSASIADLGLTLAMRNLMYQF